MIKMLLLALVLTVNPSVARIDVPDGNMISSGSGTLVAKDVVITNWHVVVDNSDDEITVTFYDGHKYDAKIIKTDKVWDLAALRLSKPVANKVIKLGEIPEIGDKLTIAGYGKGKYQESTGKLIQFVAPGKDGPTDILELEASVRQGDSGGPILDSKGRLVGVLFGGKDGLTNGSHIGRVKEFLESCTK